MMSKTASPNNCRSREEWERLMAEYEAGDLSQRVFCAQYDPAYQQL